MIRSRNDRQFPFRNHFRDLSPEIGEGNWHCATSAARLATIEVDCLTGIRHMVDVSFRDATKQRAQVPGFLGNSNMPEVSDRVRRHMLYGESWMD